MALIAILYGGRSGEHEVSCTSAAAVLRHLPDHHSALLIGIDREGIWYRQQHPDPIPARLLVSTDSSEALSIRPGSGITDSHGNRIPVEVVIPVLHGSFGEDGTVQGLLECARVAYAGSGVLGSALGMDKDAAKRMWLHEGLPVVPWRTVRAGLDDSNLQKLTAGLVRELGLPLFVKPANAGSSVGVTRVDIAADLPAALKTAWRHDAKVLVEKAVNAREIECSVMGYSDPECFPPGEVIPANGHQFYDYDAKYIDPDGASFQIPAQLDAGLDSRIREIAVRAYRAVDAGGLARVDFLVERDSGEVFLNEINTIPGMTSISLFPRMAAAGGLDFTAMLTRLIDWALLEHRRRESLSYSR